MDPKPPADRVLLAPAADGSTTVRLPSRRSWPRVDDQLVEPETRQEIVRGRTVIAAPAKAPHAERHYELDYVLRGSMAPGYIGATDLLTRAGPRSDFATDTCIRRAGIDPTTKTRYLEELAFEIVSTQSLRDITERAEDLTERGVRRVIAIFVKKGEVREWSGGEDPWVTLDPQGSLEDPTLARPIPIRALLDAAEADNVVVRALHAKKNPEIAAIEAASKAAGLRDGKAAGLRDGKTAGLREGTLKGITALCDVLEIQLDTERRAQLDRLDVAGLDALLGHLRTERRWP